MYSPLVWRLADSLIFREITYSLNNFLFFTSASSPEPLVNSDLTSYFLLADSENFKSITYSLNNSLYFYDLVYVTVDNYVDSTYDPVLFGVVKVDFYVT